MDDRTPHTADPDTVLAVLRSDDTGPDALYPAAIGVYCDECGAEVRRDFLVSDRMDRAARFETARSHLRTAGWQCTPGTDLCATCRTAEESGR